MDKKKKLIILIVLTVVILALILGTFFAKIGGSDKKKEVLKVKYSHSEKVKIKNLNKEYTKTVTVENTGEELEAYTFVWKDVENKVKDQNNFTYIIKGEGDRAPSLSKSQVPVIDSTIFTSVAIQPGVKHTYTFTFKYTGKKAKDHSFNGVLEVKSLNVNDDSNDKVKEKEKKKELEKEKDKHEKEKHESA